MEKVDRRVLAAACKYGDLVVVGVRHYDEIMNGQLRALKANEELELCKLDKVIQGFIDNQHNFLDRVEALALVKESGQQFYPERNGCTDELYSEGVW